MDIKISKEKMLEMAQKLAKMDFCPEQKVFYKNVLEMLQADTEGRLVVLPCKVGDTAFVKDRAGVPLEMRLEAPDIRFVCTDEDSLCMATCNRKPNGFCAYRIRNDVSDIGKTVFLTREEAEAALEKMGGENDGV